MKKWVLTIFITVALACSAQARMYIGNFKSLRLVASTIEMDATTPGRTFSAADRVASHTIHLSDRADSVEVIGYSTTSAVDNDSATLNIYGYAKNGPALRIASQVVFTLGTASFGTTASAGLYADTIVNKTFRRPYTTSTIGVSVSSQIANFTIATTGLRYLVFEPSIMNAADIGDFTIAVKEYGTIK